MGRFVLDMSSVNELEVQTLQRIIDMKPSCCDIVVRANGKDYGWEADWIKYLRYEE